MSYKKTTYIVLLSSLLFLNCGSSKGDGQDNPNIDLGEKKDSGGQSNDGTGKNDKPSNPDDHNDSNSESKLLKKIEAQLIGDQKTTEYMIQFAAQDAVVKHSKLMAFSNALKNENLLQNSLIESNRAVLTTGFGTQLLLQNSEESNFASFKRFDRMIETLVQEAQGKPTTPTYGFFVSGDMRAVYINSPEGQSNQEMAAFIQNAIANCLIEPFGSIKIPESIGNLQKLYCSNDVNDFLNVFFNTKFEISEKIFDDLVLNLETKYLVKSFNFMNREVCRLTINGQVDPTVVADYRNAGWITESRQDNPEVLIGECSKYYYETVWPKIVAQFDNPNAIDRKNLNPFARYFLESMTTIDKDHEKVVSDKILSFLDKTMTVPYAGLISKLDSFDELNLMMMGQQLASVKNETDFAVAIGKVLIPPARYPKTKFHEAYLAADQIIQNAFLNDLAKLLMSECSLPLQKSCVSKQQGRLALIELTYTNHPSNKKWLYLDLKPKI